MIEGRINKGQKMTDIALRSVDIIRRYGMPTPRAVFINQILNVRLNQKGFPDVGTPLVVDHEECLHFDPVQKLDLFFHIFQKSIPNPKSP